MGTLHIRYDGNSFDVALDEVDLGDLSSDEDVKVRAAQYVEQPVAKLSSFLVDRNQETGDITLRPPAVFG